MEVTLSDLLHQVTDLKALVMQLVTDKQQSIAIAGGVSCPAPSLLTAEMITATPHQVGFHALPDSEHLTWSVCGFTLMTITGLAPDISTDQIERVTLNGVDHKFRPMGATTLIMPVYLYGSREDHIVPIGGAYASTQHLSGPKRFVIGASGHIAGVINPPAKNKRSYWNYAAEQALEKLNDISVQAGTLLGVATATFDEIYLHDLPEAVQSYADYEKFSRDMQGGGELYELTFGGKTYTCTNLHDH